MPVRTNDRPLTKEEALSLADKCDIWPAGLGHILIPDDNHKRGWKRLPKWKPFSWPHPNPEGAMTCPVLQIADGRQCGSYGDFLTAWRAIIWAIATVTNQEFEPSRYYYNELLKTNPRAIAEHLREYVLTLETVQDIH